MIYLLSTAQRCGSTWLAKMLCGMAGCARSAYVDGLAVGFGLTGPSEPGAAGKLTEQLRRRAGLRVFKTHDVPGDAFDAVCGAMPGLRILTVHRDFRDTVVSRYFYLRYYWRTDPRLGPLSPGVAEFLAEIGAMPDHEALEALLETPLVRGWAREWAAFERPFTTPHARRVTYAGLLDGSELPGLAEFTGLPVKMRKAFAAEQQEETQRTGREGKARFNRRGLVGEWREWWTEEQGAWLGSLVGEAESCMLPAGTKKRADASSRANLQRKNQRKP
jgi:hypothetical protein